jgi:preprotein translocase subunit SecD
LKSVKKPTFFIIAALTLVFSWLTVFGISSYHGDNRTVWISGVEDIRWGIDIRGGVDVTFIPHESYSGIVTPEQIDAARSVIETRIDRKSVV